MKKEKLEELHKAIGGCTYNLESASREWLKYNVAPGVKSQSQLLIESSRSKIDSLIDSYFNTLLEENDELRSALIQALYHDGWAEENGEAKPIHNKLGAPKWVIKAFDVIK